MLRHLLLPCAQVKDDSSQLRYQQYLPPNETPMTEIAYEVLKYRSCTKRSPCEPILGLPLFEGSCGSEVWILRVNRQLCQEGRDVLYRENHFFVDQDSALSTFVTGPSNCQMIRSLTMTLNFEFFCGSSNDELWRFRDHLRLVNKELTGLDTFRVITKVRWGGNWFFNEIWDPWLREQRLLLLFAGYVPLRHPKLEAAHWSAKTENSEKEIGLHISREVQKKHEVCVSVSITSGNAKRTEVSPGTQTNAKRISS